MRPHHITVPAALAAIALFVGACGTTADDNAADLPGGGTSTQASAAPASAGGGKHSQHSGTAGGGTSTTGATETDAAATSAASEMEGMVTLATSEQGDLETELHAMPPERFFVSEGDALREQKPASTDDAHLMVTLADQQSGVRLPDATVTVRITDRAGATAFEGPLYPMVGRGMGLHYGENVKLGKPGTYDVQLTIGPPRVGRHRAVAKAWTTTRKITQQVKFDGKTLGPL